jgi:hypothetical protein
MVGSNRITTIAMNDMISQPNTSNTLFHPLLLTVFTVQRLNFWDKTIRLRQTNHRLGQKPPPTSKQTPPTPPTPDIFGVY